MRTAALPIEDASHVSSARREALSLAGSAGFDETRAGQVAIVVTELATNILKHAGRGEMLVTECIAGRQRGLEVLALDHGSGFARPDDSMRDGHSTAGSLGHGLGAVSRLSNRFDLFSTAGKGSVALSRLLDSSREPISGPGLAVAGLSAPKASEAISGDDWIVDIGRRFTTLLLADGLGHGLLAADAAAAAVREFARDPQRTPAAMLDDVHHALRATRGAAVGIARIDLDRDLVAYAGLGNITASIVANGSRRSLVSHNGIAGHSARHMHEFTYPLPGAATLVLHSDGLATHWNPDDYPGLWRKDPSLVAGLLYRDFTRRRDDATVVVATRLSA